MLWIPIQCSTCHGEGKVDISPTAINDAIHDYIIQDCPYCNGKGLTFIPIEDLIKEIDKRR